MKLDYYGSVDLPGRYVTVMHVGCHHHSSSASITLKTNQSRESKKSILILQSCKKEKKLP